MPIWLNQTLSKCPRPIVSASAGDVLEMQILRPHPRKAESETLGLGP